MKQYSAARPVRSHTPIHDEIIKNGLEAIARHEKNMSTEQVAKAKSQLASASQRNDRSQLCDRIASKSFQ